MRQLGGVTGVSACRCILALPRLDVEIASVQIGNTLFLPHPIVEIAAIDHLHHDLESTAILPAEYGSTPLDEQ